MSPTPSPPPSPTTPVSSKARSEERQKLFRSCPRVLTGHGWRRPGEELRELARAADPAQSVDSYGSGGALEEFEAELARLYDKPAALFLPSGTMAQQIALRIHAERSGCSSVAFHPTCHLELHEQRGYRHLHQLDVCLVGRRDRLITRADLDQLHERQAALLLELPQREIGGFLPSWEELTAQAAWAKERGVALHLDGARLWESAPFYGRSVAEVAALFDSVYVSFYKALGAIAGAALLGSKEFIAEARIWQRRHGGNLVSLYPFVLSARESLKLRLGKLEGYRAHARSVAALFAGLPGVRVAPDPPHTNLFHAYFPVPEEPLLEASAALAERHGIALVTRTRPCDVPGYSVVEISIGDAASAIPLDELGGYLRELLERAQNPL